MIEKKAQKDRLGTCGALQNDLVVAQFRSYLKLGKLNLEPAVILSTKDQNQNVDNVELRFYVNNF